MLHESILKLYRRLRLDGYRKLFGAVQEREGSLSAMEAFSADLINLLGEPTLKEFAEYSGISQPNATYKVNALASKGYVEKVVSAPDRREIRRLILTCSGGPFRFILRTTELSFDNSSIFS